MSHPHSPAPSCWLRPWRLLWHGPLPRLGFLVAHCLPPSPRSHLPKGPACSRGTGSPAVLSFGLWPFWPLASGRASGSVSSRTQVPLFLGPRSSAGPSSNIALPVNQCFPGGLLHCAASSPAVIGNTRGPMVVTLTSNDAALLSVIFPSSSVPGLLSLRLLLISCLHL